MHMGIWVMYIMYMGTWLFSRACCFAVLFCPLSHDTAGVYSQLFAFKWLTAHKSKKKKASKGLGLNRCTCANTIKLVSASSFSLSLETVILYLSFNQGHSKGSSEITGKTITSNMTILGKQHDSDWYLWLLLYYY